MSGKKPSPMRDEMAGKLLQELREAKGLSREQLPYAMLLARIPSDKVPSVKTIYNVERHGQIPRVRLMFGFAQFYERDLHDIWPVDTRRPAISQRKRVAA